MKNVVSHLFSRIQQFSNALTFDHILSGSVCIFHIKCVSFIILYELFFAREIKTPFKNFTAHEMDSYSTYVQNKLKHVRNQTRSQEKPRKRTRN